jgi:hypothetical protein
VQLQNQVTFQPVLMLRITISITIEMIHLNNVHYLSGFPILGIVLNVLDFMDLGYSLILIETWKNTSWFLHPHVFCISAVSAGAATTRICWLAATTREQSSCGMVSLAKGQRSIRYAPGALIPRGSPLSNTTTVL